ncbi:MAG: S41 family peptidase [Clostridiales bacterium]|jgi:carboxyl-terminal processing protease|nr:S41 family peptidase [Clostridiales bacterium]
MDENKKSFLKGAAVSLAIIVIGAFIFNGYKVAWRKRTNAAPEPRQKINEIVSVLDKFYVDDIDQSKLIETMYSGLVYGVGDPYTTYMNKEEFELFKEQTSGKYAGIGVVVMADAERNRIRVVSPFEGSPGAQAGILPGDEIIKVNGFDVFADQYEEVVSMLRGEPGTSVNLTLYRNSEMKTVDVNVLRRNIDVPTVSHKMMEDDIGYLRINGFERTTYAQFVEAYSDLQTHGMKGLVIDVRNNPGGLLDIVTKIADALVPKGYIVYTEDKAGKKEYSFSDSRRINMPLAILVNENSASASEVLSGAVQDMKVGVLVGTKTFGKGLVQNLFELSDGSAVKVTVAKYYTPNGICINGEGLIPDHYVDMDKNKSFDLINLAPEDDEQLQAALDIVFEQMAAAEETTEATRKDAD